MQNFFFGASHPIAPKEKTAKWAAQVMYEYYYFGGAQSLLEGKKPVEVRDYVAGNQSVDKFRKMFRKASRIAGQQPAQQPSEQQQLMGIPNASQLKDLAGIDWQPLALLTQPFNSAISIMQKMPIYCKCTAIDALAREKKATDQEFLRNRAYLDASIAQFSQAMQAPMDPPSAPNNASGVDISAFDLNPAIEDELNFYMDMFYKLRPESAFECALYALAYQTELRKVRDLEDRDQFFYGVSCNRAYMSDITGLPAVEYQYPGEVFTPRSDLPDFSDQDFRYIKKTVTASQLMDYIGSDIDEDILSDIMDAEWGLRKLGDPIWSARPEADRSRSMAEVDIVYFEFKTWDSISFHKKKKANGNFLTELVGDDYQLRYSMRHPNEKLRGKDKEASDDEYLERKWAQQTYKGYFLPCYPETVFRFGKLECSLREHGRETMSPYSINIWKSQEKGAAELCIPLVDQAQKAVYKLQHAIVMAKPKGMFIDTKYMRQAVINLVSTDLKFGMQDLFTMLVDQNIMIGDSEGIDPMELQAGSRPFYEIPGGLSGEAEGYLMIINDAIMKIQRITGANDALTGQSPVVDSLVGVQKLMLQSSINSFYYVQNAQRNQTEKVFRLWGCMVQWILKNKNSAAAKALTTILSNYKADVIRDLDEVPLHAFGIMVENAPDEQQQAELNQMLLEGYQSGRITGSDYTTLKRIFSWKDASQLFAIRERKSRERAARAAQEAQQGAIQAKSMEEQTKMQIAQSKNETTLQKTATEGEIQQWLAKYKAQVDAGLLQLQGMIKRQQQTDRIEGQLQKVDRQKSGTTQQPFTVTG